MKQAIFISIICILIHSTYGMDLIFFKKKSPKETIAFEMGTLQKIPTDLLYKIFAYCPYYTHCAIRSTNNSLNKFLSPDNFNRLLHHNINVNPILFQSIIKNDNDTMLNQLLDIITKQNYENQTSLDDNIPTNDCIVIINDNSNQKTIQFIKKLLCLTVRYNAEKTFHSLAQLYKTMTDNQHDTIYYNELLHQAANHNSDKIANALIRYGATVNYSLHDTTPFELALLKKNHAVMNVLMNYSDGVQEMEVYKQKRCLKWTKLLLLPPLIITGLGMIVIEFSRIHYNSTKIEY